MKTRWRVDPAEVEFSAIRSQGTGGQNVNKVSSAAHLRFDIGRSTMSETDKARLLAWPDQRISGQGTVVIKAQSHRSLAANQLEALTRLQALVDAALEPATPRIATRPTRASRKRRLEDKSRHAMTKTRRRLPATGEG